MSETQAEKEARWEREWKAALHGGSQGNPFATLCDHCYGRHKPPRDKECTRAALPPTEPPR
jgi:hypothetical protein